jgi:hypothetical protein
VYGKLFIVYCQTKAIKNFHILMQIHKKEFNKNEQATLVNRKR